MTDTRLRTIGLFLALFWTYGAAEGADQVSRAAQNASIEINVVVEGDHHSHPTDLTAQDFEILDDSHPQKIASVKLNGGAPRELSILIDSSSNDSVRLAEEFVNASNLENTEVSLWDSSQLELIQPFTSDKNVLSGALSRFIADAGKPKTGAGGELLPIPVDAVVRDAYEHVQNEQMRPWMAILFSLAKQEGTVAGRKEALFFAGSEDKSSASSEQVEALISNAAHAGLNVYVVESRLLTATQEARATKLMAGKVKSADRKKQSAATDQDAAAGAQNLLRDLAEKTGGLYAVSQTGAAAEVLNAVKADIGVSYELRYDAESGAFDGHFRKLEIKCTRAQTRVRAPAGYVSAPAVSYTSLSAYEPALYGYLSSNGDAGQSDLPFECQALQFARKNGKLRTAIVVELPLRKLQAEEDETRNTSRLHFSFLALVKSEDGQIIQKLSQDVVLEQAANAKTNKNLFAFAQSIWLEPGKYQLNVVARDQNSLRTGMREMAITATPSDSEIQLADILLVQDAEIKAASPSDDDPLSYGSARIIPFASSHIGLSKGAQLPVLVTVYSNSGSEQPEIELELRRGDKVLGTFPLMASVQSAGDYQALVMLEQGSLTPGHYTFVARAANGSKAAEQRKEVDVVEPGTSDMDEGEQAAPAPSAPVLSLEEPELPTAAEKISSAEILKVLAGARERASEYKKMLPNFSCVETTQQYTSKVAHTPDWKIKNTFSELLRYASGAESYQTLEVNGERRSTPHDTLPGLRLRGEFGELLDAIYSEHASADFSFKGKARIDGAEVYVVGYSVKRPHSAYMLSNTDGSTQVQCSFHGLVYIDARDYMTRYVSIEAQDIPENAQYRESTLYVTYDFINFEGEQFLLPKKASVSVRVGKKKLMKDDIQFRDYHRYHSATRLIFQ